MTGPDEFDGFLGKFSLPLFHEGRFLANPSEPVIPSVGSGNGMEKQGEVKGRG